jgi:hypothetical protein
VEQRQPGDHPVVLDVELRADLHRGDVGVQVAVGDAHGLRLGRRTARELQQRGVALVGHGRVGGDRARPGQVVERAEGDAALGEHRRQRVERRTQQHQPRVDHLEDRHCVLGPGRQIGARSGLVQHRHAAAGEPHGLRGRGDGGGLPGEHPDGGPAGQPGQGRRAGLERGGHVESGGVHLGPRAPHGCLGLARGHAAVGADGRRQQHVEEAGHGRKPSVPGEALPRSQRDRG